MFLHAHAKLYIFSPPFSRDITLNAFLLYFSAIYLGDERLPSLGEHTLKKNLPSCASCAYLRPPPPSDEEVDRKLQNIL